MRRSTSVKISWKTMVVIRVKSLIGQVDAANHSFAGTRTANENPESGFRIVVVTMVETTESPGLTIS